MAVETTNRENMFRSRNEEPGEKQGTIDNGHFSSQSGTNGSPGDAAERNSETGEVRSNCGSGVSGVRGGGEGGRELDDGEISRPVTRRDIRREEIGEGGSIVASRSMSGSLRGMSGMGREGREGSRVTAGTEAERSLPLSSAAVNHQEKGYNQDYLRFLRDKERKACVDGFLDSKRYQTSYVLRRKNEEKLQRRVRKDQGHQGDKGTVWDLQNTEDKPTNVITVATKREQDERDFEQTISTIEKYMIKYKTESRDLKRQHGDIAKSQRHVRQTLRDYEMEVAERQLREEKLAEEKLTKYTTMQRQQIQQQQQFDKERAKKSEEEVKKFKEKDRQAQLQTAMLARRYQTKAEEVELTRLELTRLSADYEKKLQLKEDQQYRLKKEMIDLAIALNMEAHKAGVDERHYQREKIKKKEEINNDREAELTLNKRLQQSAADTRAAELSKRKLSSDLAAKTAQLQEKQREDARRKLDTERRLAENRRQQMELVRKAQEIEAEQKIQEIEAKVKEHVERRDERQTSWLSHRRQVNSSTQATAQKYQQRQTQLQLHDLDDLLNEYKRAVDRGEEIEGTLAERVKAADEAHRAREQSVARLQRRLAEAKREHTARLRQESLEFQKQENSMEQKLIRERAELNKLHADKEMAYADLTSHREKLRQDRSLVMEHAKERDRLARILRHNQVMT